MARIPTLQFVVLCLAGALSVFPSRAAEPGSVAILTAVRTADPPAIDGIPDPAFAERAIPGAMLRDEGPGLPRPLPPRVDLLHDDDALYLLVVVPEAADGRPVMPELAICLGVDPGAPEGTRFTVSMIDGRVRDLSGIARRDLASASVPHPSGKAVEVRVGFAPYGVPAPKAGDRMPLTLARTAAGAEGLERADADRMPATIRFADTDAGPDAAALRQLRRAGPGSTRLCVFTKGGYLALGSDGTAERRPYAEVARAPLVQAEGLCEKLRRVFERDADLPGRQAFASLDARREARAARVETIDDPLACARQYDESRELEAQLRSLLHGVRLELLNRTF